MDLELKVADSPGDVVCVAQHDHGPRNRPFSGGRPARVQDRARILIADDDPALHEDYRKCLLGKDEAPDLRQLEAQFMGTVADTIPKLEFELVHVHQGEQAIVEVERRLQQQQRFAVAFVDGRMPPGLDGIETVRRIWQLDPEIQVVIGTAYSDFTWDETLHRVGRSEGLHLLRKPFSPEQVHRFASVLAKKWLLRRTSPGQASGT